MLELTAISIICAIIIVYLKNVNSELAFLATVASGIIIISAAFTYLSDTFLFINELMEITGIDKEYYVIIFKVTAIGYLTEFGAGIIEDFGLKSLSDKLVLVGKIIILAISLPIIYAVFNLLKGLIKWA
ncbi:MAG: hypothetical protein J6Q32_00675 [Clostridia bacterium]|nr:hypothetical protein [Clostridia bacterium]